MKIVYYVIAEFLFSEEPTVSIVSGPFHTEIEAWLWVVDQDIHHNLFDISVMPILLLR